MDKNRSEFSKIYDTYSTKIYRFIFLKVSSQEIAEDLASEVFIKAWGAFQARQIENIQAYIYQVARNAIADHYKGKKLQTVSVDETIEILDSQKPIEKQAMVSMEMDRVQKAISTINNDYQDLIIWHYLDELSVPEIAQITGKTEENVRVGIHRALEALRGKVEA